MPATAKTILLFWVLVIFGNGYGQQPRLMLPVGHVGNVDLKFSPDGKKMLTKGDDGTAKLWDSNSGMMLADLVGHRGNIVNAEFTSNGQKIVTIAEDNTIRIWSTASGELLRTLDANKGKIQSVELHTNDKQLIVFYDSSNINVGVVWDINSGKLLSVMNESQKREDGKIYAIRPVVRLSPDGKQILRTDTYKLRPDSSIVVITDAFSSRRRDTLDGFIPVIRTLQYSPDGKTIMALGGYYHDDTTQKVAGLTSKTMRTVIMVWNAATGRLIRTIELSRLKSRYDYGQALSIERMKFWFDPADKNILLINDSYTIEAWNLSTGKLVSSLWEQTKDNRSYLLGKDNKTVVVNDGKSLKAFAVTSGKLLRSFEHDSEIVTYQVNETAGVIVTHTKDNKIYIWDNVSGKLLRSLDCKNEKIISMLHSPFDKWLAIVSEGPEKEKKEDEEDKDEGEEENEIIQMVKLWDWSSDKLLWSVRRPSGDDFSVRFSPDGKNIAVYHKILAYYSGPEIGMDNVEILDAKTGRKKSSFLGNASYVRSAVLSPDEKRIVTTYDDSSAKIWDVQKGQFTSALNGHTDVVNMVQFSKDGKYIVTASDDSTARIWDANSGRIFYTLGEHEAEVYSARFSMDGKYITTASDDDSRIWDAATGKLLRVLQGGGGNDAQFSPDGKYIVSDAKIFDTSTGELLFELDWHNGAVNSNQFSNDGKYIVTASSDETAKVWSLEYGEMLYSLDDHTDDVVFAVFSEDDKKIITASLDNTVKIWDVQTGDLKKSIDLGPNSVVKDIHLKGNKLLCVNAGSETKIINLSTGERLYSFFAMDSSDYLVVDKHNRFDGTESARKLLYFTCNDEIIELDQVKDQLWTPGLAERIIKGDSINALKLSDLNICGLTPEVKEKGDKSDSYQFKIIPRRGGLGETALFLNGIEIKRYTKSQLKYNAGAYDLVVLKRELLPYFIPGQENPVTVKAWVADNSISSRGLIIKEDKTKETTIPPNLYAVMVGVSDYKGDELDLKYAAKDAADISATLEAASKKLFNIDSNQHVFTYILTTANDRYMLPEKNSIKKTLEEIGKKATANDILLIFFAGHGVMSVRTGTDGQGTGKQQFYFLTADASKSTITNTIAQVGISTDELAEWMKPANIKAQKRVLIFDACNSGQAIRDFVQLGKPDQGYNSIVARNDEKGQQIKAIEKLNNQSGLIILAASASNQDAYEMSRYSQGLLTYALLKVLKQQPEILDRGKYLDVTNWLNAAKKVVGTLAEATGARQEPQLNSNNNFNIGLVDDEVRNKITLAAENPMFTRSNFQNADTKLDNLKLLNAINKKLMNSGDQAVSYSADYEGADAFTLNGDYRISGDEVVVSVILVKGGADIKHRFEIKGKKDKPDTIAALIISSAIDWLRKNR